MALTPKRHQMKHLDFDLLLVRDQGGRRFKSSLPDHCFDHQQLVFSVLDPLKALGSKLWSLETAGHNFANWDLSRDGENIA